MFSWYAREKWGSYLSLVACEGCLEVCFVGLVVGRNYVWCLSIVVIFMEFGQARAKSFGVCLLVINWVWRCKSQKGDSFHRKARFSLSNNDVLWNFFASLTGYIYTVKDFIRYLFSLYYCCFTCLRLARPKVQLKLS